MLPRSTIAALFVSTVTAFALPAGAEPPPDDALACTVDYQLAAIAAESGYDHVVRLSSSCGFTLVCSVSLEDDVSDVALSAQQTRAIVVDQNEGEAAFEAEVRCFPLEDA